VEGDAVDTIVVTDTCTPKCQNRGGRERERCQGVEMKGERKSLDGDGDWKWEGGGILNLLRMECKVFFKNEMCHRQMLPAPPCTHARRRTRHKHWHLARRQGPSCIK